MALLPIVDRELRVVSRKTSLYWGRLLFAGVGIMTLCLYSLSKDVPSRMSQAMFESLAMFTFVYCALAGVWATADCLSEERRGETLGLLFLTNLRGIDVVLGKMMATSLRSVYGVLAVFPVMAVPLILGGVDFAEFCRVMFVLLVTLFVSLSLGVVVSSRSRSAVKSGAAVFFLMLGLCLFGPLLALILELTPYRSTQGMVSWMSFHSPGFALFSSFDSYYPQVTFFFWASAILNIVLTLGMLSLACFFVQRGWRDPSPDERGKGIVVPSLSNHVRPPVKSLSRVRDANPIFWSLSRQRTKPKRVLTVLGILGLLWLGGSWLIGDGFFNEANYLFTAFLVQLILKCWVGAEATTRFGDDRRSGALELLLCTPIRIRDIVSGHWQSFYWQFFWPVFFVLLIDVVFLLDPLTSRVAFADSTLFFWVKIFVASMILFIIDLYALSWLGMWKGLSGRFVNRAIFSNLISVLALPWIAFILIAILVEETSLRHLYGARDEEFFLGVWFVLGCASSVYWAYLGRRRLVGELRRLAPFQAGDPRAVQE
ncbi:ABC transporter permease [Verrucomicrobia bacterium]|nr:ABC transporter permease [Verrucomicrobiota bacterium]